MTGDPTRSHRWVRMRSRLSGAASAARQQTAAAARVANTTRDRVIREACGVLEYIARVSAVPLRMIGLAPLVPGLLLVVTGLVIGGAARAVGLMLAALAVVVSMNLLWRRQRMLTAIRPPEALAQEVATALDLADAWGGAEEAIAEIRAEHARRRGRFRHLRSVLSTLKLGQQLTSRVSDLSRIAPFLPASLSLTWASVVAAVVATAVLTGVAVLMFVVMAVTGF